MYIYKCILSQNKTGCRKQIQTFPKACMYIYKCILSQEASQYFLIEYPKPDGIVSFDVPTSLYRSNTNHDRNQPAHLRLRNPKVSELVNLPKYASPESRYCPAREYEYVSDDNEQLKLQINAQNCLHFKPPEGYTGGVGFCI